MTTINAYAATEAGGELKPFECEVGLWGDMVVLSSECGAIPQFPMDLTRHRAGRFSAAGFWFL